MRINLSGSGVSLGLGPRGANVNIGKRGVRTTVGLPGTGVSHQTFQPWGSGQDTTPAPSPAPQQLAATPPSKGRHSWRKVTFAFGLLAVGLWGVWPKDQVSKPIAPQPVQPVAAISTPSEPKATPGPPAPARPLNIEEVREVQVLLKAVGFDPGGADGIVGPMTIAAVKRYEPSRGWPPSGEIDMRLLESLRASKAAPATPAARPPAPPAPAAPLPAPASPPVTIVPNAEMQLASRAIREAGHPCGTVAAAVRLSDGSVRAVCSNSEIYRVMTVRGELVAMKCSAAQRMGIQGC